MNKYYAMVLGLSLSFAMFSGAEAHPAESQEKGICIAEVEADLDGDKKPETVELYGEKLLENSNYYTDLMLIAKNKNDDVITAYIPSLDGGYALMLEKANITDKNEQIILRSRRGADSSVEICVIDFSNRKEVKELFNKNNRVLKGTYDDGYKAKVSFGDKTDFAPIVNKNEVYSKTEIYDALGKVKKSHYKPQMLLDSFTVTDVDGDKKDEILITEKMLGALREDLAYVTAAWRYNDGVLTATDCELNEEMLEEDRFTRTVLFGNGCFYPQKAVYKMNEVVYPIFAVEEKLELQGKINLLLSDIYQKYIDKLGSKASGLDYTFPYAGARFVSMVFFGITENDGKEVFERRPLNIDVISGEILTIDKVLNLKNKELLPKIKELTKDDKVNFDKGLPKDWYYNGKNFVFCQKDTNGIWQEATAEAEKLKDYLVDENLL